MCQHYGRRPVSRLRDRLSHLAALLMAALVLGLGVLPTASQALAPQSAFAQGDQDPSPVTGIEASAGSATAAPEASEPSATPDAPEPSATTEASVTPSASAMPTAPLGTPPAAGAVPTSPRDESPGAATTRSAPTIASDLADYPPGGTVSLSGVGWQPGEVVTIAVNDTGGLSWSLTRTVVTDAEGRVTLTFDLPNHYVPDYDVTATGELSGVASTTFTDAANGSWQYWMTAPTPANGSVSAGATITYVLNAQKTGSDTTPVSGAMMTLTLTGSATFADGTKTFTWSPASLDFAGSSTTVIATASPTAIAGGAIVATIAMASTSTMGVPLTSPTQFVKITHTVPVTNKCHFAKEGSGAYASSICWFDLSGYNATTAASTNGQTMRQTLPGDYTLTYTIKVGSADAAAAAKKFPTWTGSYLGNPDSGVGGYQGILGMPAIYQSAGGTTTLALSGIALTNSSRTKVSGFALVGADAESTDDNEWISWTTSAPATFTSVGPLGNACGGGFTGDGTTTVKCTGGVNVGAKNGTPILYSKDPTTFTQTMVGSGLQGVGFGVMVSGVQLKKTVVNPVKSSDGFDIAVASGGTTLGSRTADAASGWTADTGQVPWILAGSIQNFTMTESPNGSTRAENYAVTWACTINGAEYPLTDTSATTQIVKLEKFSDFIVCTITNTGPSLTLRKTTTGVEGGPFGFTLTNTTQASGSVTTTAAETAAQVDGATSSDGTQPFTVSSVGNEVKVVETSLAGWQLASATCVNASGTAVGSLSGSVYTIPAVSVVAGSAFTCDFTNRRIPPRVTLRKTTTSLAGGPFGFTLTNTTQASATVTTSAPGTTALVGTFTVSSFGSQVTITEGAQASWVLTSATCKDASSTVVGTLIGSSYTIPASEIIAGAVITCDYTNRPYAGTVTWSKVDAGSTSTLLAGSAWTLTGPSYPTGTTVADCTSPSCAGPDTDPVAGRFKIPVLCGTYTLVEKTAPIGFRLGTTEPPPFTVANDGETVDVGAITNERSVVPALPLTGGASTDAFLLAGYALIAAAGFAAWRQRRRLLRSS